MISTKSAKNVEIIHTNSGTLGIARAVGTIDFYPNGGSHQLGCARNIAGMNCCHQRSHQYFAESLTSQLGFKGVRCENFNKYKTGACYDDKVLMGGNKKASPSGKFYLVTNARFPFAKGSEGIYY